MLLINPKLQIFPFFLKPFISNHPYLTLLIKLKFNHLLLLIVFLVFKIKLIFFEFEDFLPFYVFDLYDICVFCLKSHFNEYLQ